MTVIASGNFLKVLILRRIGNCYMFKQEGSSSVLLSPPVPEDTVAVVLMASSKGSQHYLLLNCGEDDVKTELQLFETMTRYCIEIPSGCLKIHISVRKYDTVRLSSIVALQETCEDYGMTEENTSMYLSFYTLARCLLLEKSLSRAMVNTVKYHCDTIMPVFVYITILVIISTIIIIIAITTTNIAIIFLFLCSNNMT